MSYLKRIFSVYPETYFLIFFLCTAILEGICGLYGLQIGADLVSALAFLLAAACTVAVVSLVFYIKRAEAEWDAKLKARETRKIATDLEDIFDFSSTSTTGFWYYRHEMNEELYSSYFAGNATILYFDTEEYNQFLKEQGLV